MNPKDKDHGKTVTRKYHGVESGAHRRNVDRPF